MSKEIDSNDHVDSNVWAYVSCAIVVVLCVVLLAQVFAINPRRYSIGNRQIIVEVPGGIISAPKEQVAATLRAMGDKIRCNAVTVIDPGLIPLINKSTKNLAEFIRNTPHAEADLCNIGPRTDQQLQSTVTPYPVKWRSGYSSILEHENDSRESNDDPVTRLQYLLRNIDIAVYLLKNDICDYGRIDLVKLRNILLAMNKQLFSLRESTSPQPEFVRLGDRPYTVDDPWHGNGPSEHLFDVPAVEWADLPDKRTYAFQWDREVELNSDNSSH